MGFNTIVTPEDIKRTEGTEPGWYQAEIVNYEEATTKGSELKPSDGSTNAIFEFKLLSGPSTGRTFKKYINEKTPHWAKNLWAIIIPGFDAKKGGKLSSEANRASVGKKLMVYVKKNKEGFDNVEDYRPM